MKVLVCDPIDKDSIKHMTENGITVDVKTELSPEELKRTVKDYQGIIVRSRTKITKDIIEAAPKLQFIARPGVGLDNIDVKTAEEKEIKVLNTPRANTEAVAELAVGLMLAVARRISSADHSVKQGEWLKTKFLGYELAGKTLGIIGAGRIGLKVAQIARAIGMKVLVYDVLIPKCLDVKKSATVLKEDEDSVKKDERLQVLDEIQAEPVTIQELYANSDVISIHVPLTKETEGLIGEKEIALMKKKPIIINTARGPIIEEKALKEALKTGKLSGTGLDVFKDEPPKDLELVKLANVVCTPHIGSQTEEAQKIAGLQLAEKIIKLKTG